jgi:ABC-2 type transport system ATP-binding protein
MTPETVVDIRDLRKVFGRRAKAVCALDGVTLSLGRGEVFGLLGRNGAGKTTLVRTLLGLLRPSSGSARVFGVEATDLSVRRRIGFSPEEPEFPRYLRPRQVLEFCGTLAGLSGADLRTAVDRQLALSELDVVGARQARELSKGMKQRLSLAQAFLHRPELLILDEPTADLDPIGRRQVRDMIVEYRAGGGTVLVNSHLLSEVERICDRVAIIHRGRVMREGGVDDLLADGKELEDVFVEVIAAAGGGAGYAGTPPAPASPDTAPPVSPSRVGGWAPPQAPPPGSPQ